MGVSNHLLSGMILQARVFWFMSAKGSGQIIIANSHDLGPNFGSVLVSGTGTPAISGKCRLVKNYSIWPERFCFYCSKWTFFFVGPFEMITWEIVV